MLNIERQSEIVRF